MVYAPDRLDKDVAAFIAADRLRDVATYQTYFV